ncbi:LysR family transcriptional regulator [Morganella psychrotolerans]|uniref:LysR family transcriptional regulator n=1 Tax=Morganella psychrotolerans TaxID=368603 RepID=UPI0039B01634
MALDLNLLPVFLTVAEQGSFTAASVWLGMPSSNVSRAIKQLETQTGCRLIERTTRRMRLTAQGQQLFQRVRQTDEMLRETLSQIRDDDALTGCFRLTVPGEGGGEILAGIIARFAAAHPGLQIRCDTRLTPADIISDDIDLLLTYQRGEIADSSYHSRLIQSWASVVVAAPSLLARTGMPESPSDLTKFPCISSLSALNGQPWIFCKPDGGLLSLRINSHYQVNSGVLAGAAAIEGVGFAILSRHLCEPAIREGKLQVIRFREEPAPIELRAVYASRRELSPVVDRFLHFLDISLQNKN